MARSPDRTRIRKRTSPADKRKPWVQGDGYRSHGVCGALSLQDAECIQDGNHKGWHLADDGTAWSPDDPAQSVQFSTLAG